MSEINSLIDSKINLMRPPKDMHIICIDITNKCDLACSNCTRLLENQSEYWEMTLENFSDALDTLSGYKGIIAIIGGNPTMHSKFEDICRIFVQKVPNKKQRGLWTNNGFKHNDLIVSTFGAFNLNPHGEARGIKSLEDIYERSGRVGNIYYENAFHSPILVASRDVIGDPIKMWDKIINCDINKYWSATLIQVNGSLKLYFCEVAASFDLARNEDNGITPYPGWWKSEIVDFKKQIKHFCPGCGVPLRIKGVKDSDEVDQYSISNIDIVNKSISKKRKVIFIKDANELVYSSEKVTDYTPFHLRAKNIISKIIRKITNRRYGYK